MIEEILPGLFHWSAFHDGIGHLVHSSFEASSGTLIDPMEPEDGLEAVAGIATPRRVVLSNRHHYRHGARHVERFDCSVLCHKAGLTHFSGTRPVQGFSFDEQLADGVRALELGSICAEETTLLLEAQAGALSFGDGLTRNEDGSLAFMRDSLLGDDPQGVRRGLLRNLRRMLDEDFDTLLFAHSEPVRNGGRDLLTDFISRETGATTQTRGQAMTVDRRYEQQEADLAASEAAGIGGLTGEEDLDPAQRPVSEAGGGEAEGFEQTEAALIDHASHGDQQPAHAILHDQGPPEEENLSREDAEADQEHSSELDNER